MNNGMSTIGLLIIPFIGFILLIYLIIKFINFVSNKTKMNKIDNIPLDYEFKKENPINIKTNLYKIFILVSILICAFLPPFVNNMTSKFPTAYPGSEASSGIITSEIANQISIYIWPILIIYLSMFIKLIIKKNNCRKVYYPLFLFTLIVILSNLNIIYFGYMILWYLISLFLPIIIFILTLSIIGNKLDNNEISKKSVSIILISVLSIMLIILSSNFINTQIEEPIYNYEKIEEQQNNNYEKIKNNIKEVFNTLLDSNFISINNIELNTDYTTINSIELLIITNNVPNNEIDFCNKLIDSYNNIKELLNEYKYDSQNIDFKFTNKNPFAKETSIHYQSGGYIKDVGSFYHIYLNPTPLEIIK